MQDWWCWHWILNYECEKMRKQELAIKYSTFQSFILCLLNHIYAVFTHIFLTCSFSGITDLSVAVIPGPGGGGSISVNLFQLDIRTLLDRLKQLHDCQWSFDVIGFLHLIIKQASRAFLLSNVKSVIIPLLYRLLSFHFRPWAASVAVYLTRLIVVPVSLFL